MGSDLDFVNPPVLPGNSSSSQSVTALLVCSFSTIPGFSGWNRNHGRGGDCQLPKVLWALSLACLECGLAVGFRSLQGQSSHHLSGSWVLSQGWATLTGMDSIPVCSRFPSHSCGLLPLQGPWISIPSTSACRESKAALSALLPSDPSGPSPGSPVPLPLPCTEDPTWDAVVCTETLVLCKQEQKDYLYFNPISSEPTNICQTRWAVKAPCFPAELSVQELKKL